MTFSISNAAHNHSGQETEWIGRNMYICGKLANGQEDVSKVSGHVYSIRNLLFLFKSLMSKAVGTEMCMNFIRKMINLMETTDFEY